MKSEAWNIELAKFKFLQGFKIPCFYYFLGKIQAFSRPGKEIDKIPGFLGFPGWVGSLMELAFAGVFICFNGDNVLHMQQLKCQQMHNQYGQFHNTRKLSNVRCIKGWDIGCFWLFSILVSGHAQTDTRST